MSACVCLCVSACECICMAVCVRASEFVDVSMSVYPCVSASVYVSASLCWCNSVCVCVYLCDCICVCVCVQVKCVRQECEVRGPGPTSHRWGRHVHSGSYGDSLEKGFMVQTRGPGGLGGHPLGRRLSLGGPRARHRKLGDPGRRPAPRQE